MKFLVSSISVYRYFSTKTTKWSQNGFKKKKYNPKTPTRTKVKWTDEQSQIFAAISRGESVFVTGSAGTGKTVLLSHIISLLKKIHGPSRVFVTASTGKAACAINGQTLHSFAGIGLGEADREDLLDKVFGDSGAKKRWNKVKALVIDEISLVSAEIFDKLEYIAREVRYGLQGKVWGGIQLVVSGDFFQLPPIIDKEKSKGGKEFAFEADCWNSSFGVQVELEKIFRQSDGQLIKLLQGIRKGECGPEELKLIEQCSSKMEPDSSVVRLYPLIEDVNNVNQKQLVSLGEEISVYNAIDSGEEPWKNQLKQGIAPDALEVCVGARVMLNKNLNFQRKLVNGATGTVIDFYEPEPDDDDAMDVMALCCEGLLPVVKFDSGPELVIYPETWAVMEGEEVKATRKQIPLILAWALSIHKCQGMTLDSLHTDLSKAFGCGMVYVALSRLRSLDGLHLSGFNPSKVKAHKKVLDFYQSFSGKQDTQSEDDGANKNKSSDSHLVGLHLSGFDPSKVKAHQKVLNFYQSFAGKQDTQSQDDGADKNRSSGCHLVGVSNLVSSEFLSTKARATSESIKSSQSGGNNEDEDDRINPTTPERTRFKWTDEQAKVFAAISRGESVFITGSAGTGKTILVSHSIKLLKKIHGPSQVFVTSSTAMAAWALKGQTLHSFAGIGPGEAERKNSLAMVLLDRSACQRWNKVKALVIDNISMVSAELFDGLEYIARVVRDEQHSSKNMVWGGIQLVVSGDFFQLPPILGNRKPKAGKKFAFEADCWNSSFDMQVELTTNFRQTGKLFKLLQDIRIGQYDSEDLQLIYQCSLKTEPDSDVVRLYPLTKDVNRVNQKQIVSLGEDIVVYHAINYGEDPWKKQLKQGIVPDTLEVCVGARVMLNKNVNVSDKLVNGATGTVIGFYEAELEDTVVLDMCCEGVLPVVKLDSGPELVIYPQTWEVKEGVGVKATRKQIPLILAWALSIHKCLGMTLDSVHTDVSRAFGCGMVYVALSRVRSLDGLHISGFDPSKVKAHPKVLQFYQSFASKQDKQ